MGNGAFKTVYPGVWTPREEPYAKAYQDKIRELEERGPIDVEALISGRIPQGTQGFTNMLEVKEDMMRYNAQKYDPDNPLYSDDAYAQSLGYASKLAMPAFGAHDDSFLTPFDSRSRDFLAVTGLQHSITQLKPVYAGDRLYMVKDKLELHDLTPPEGSVYRNLYLRTFGSVYNQKGERVLEVMFSARENLKSYEDPADFTPETRSWISPDWWARPQHYYSDEDWQEIFEIWAQEDMRGDSVLYWEDVNIGDMPHVTLDGPIHSSVTPTAPFGMAIGGSRTMRELTNPEEREKMVRDPDTGLYFPKDMRQWDPEVPPYGGPVPQPTTENKRGVFINYLGRDFAIRHINNWMGTHGWIKNLRWGIMTNPVEQGLCFPKNPFAMDLVSPVPALQGKKTTTHGLQYDVVKIHSQVYDKYEKDGMGYVELGFWITTIHDDEIYEEGGATICLPRRNGMSPAFR